MTDEKQSRNKLSGRVAAVLDGRELILDIGRSDGVEVGMRFAVVGTVMVKVSDTKLVEIPYAKTIVKIVRFIDDDLSIGRTFRTIPGRKGKDGIGSVLGGTPDIPDRTETINTGDERAALAGKDMVVRQGDLARETTGDEFLDPV